MQLLVTGGAGFIGSNFVRHALNRWPDCRLTVLDKLTYSGNRANLADCEADGRMRFIKGDICDPVAVAGAIRNCSAVINFAAETHVDRSIRDSSDFVRTDIEGTRVLLEAARVNQVERYIQVSTDEVYGEIAHPARSSEHDVLRPRSPYAASKAGGDLMALAYHTTHGVPALIGRASNNFGPYQFPEKLIPLFITNALQEAPLPLYGDGRQERDWLAVEDHCVALSLLLERGEPGQIYNIGTGVERPNIDVAERILNLVGRPPSLIRHVTDRPGHDRRYALSCDKIRALGWSPRQDFDTALAETVQWYRSNDAWWRACRGDEFAAYYAQQYDQRLQDARA